MLLPHGVAPCGAVSVRGRRRRGGGQNLLSPSASPSPSSSSLLLATVLLATTVHARERNSGVVRYEDPNSRLVCEGTLAEYAACQCKADEGEISCINAQFVDANIFQEITGSYKFLTRVTFHGNNFQDLPSGSLFGSSSYSNLVSLNISANYVVNLNSNALQGLHNLDTLDLSNNEIVLKEGDIGFLSHTPRLTELYLRRALTSTLNRTVQFDYMMRMFRKAKLDRLQVLDLSYNYLQTIPFDLLCPFPSLTRLDLRQNFLKTFSVNESCLASVRTIDLSRNQMHHLDSSFRSLANALRPNTLLLKNSFYCDCKSADYIKWLRSTPIVREKSGLVCERASPPEFKGARLVEVQLEKLDCLHDLYASKATTATAVLASTAALLIPLLLI